MTCSPVKTKIQTYQSEFYIFPEPPRQGNETVNGVQIWTRGCTHKGMTYVSMVPTPQANTLKLDDCMFATLE